MTQVKGNKLKLVKFDLMTSYTKKDRDADWNQSTCGENKLGNL